MTTISELSASLGVSKSTLRRRLRECLPEVQGEGRKPIDLTQDQVHRLVHHMAQCGAPRNGAVGAATTSKNSVFGASGDAGMVHQVAQGGAPYDAVVAQLEQVRGKLHDAELEAARLRAEVDGLRSENSLLRERLEVADAALKREQEQARGFLSRLGQRLLGSGRETR